MLVFYHVFLFCLDDALDDSLRLHKLRVLELVAEGSERAPFLAGHQSLHGTCLPRVLRPGF